MSKEEYIDMYFVKIKCPKCGKKTHEPVTGMFNIWGEYLVQRHCNNCHHTDVKNHMRGYVREGIIE